MKQLETIPEKNLAALEKVLIQGDLAPLTANQRIEYVNEVARAIGINPLLRPFDYITFHGKIVLYANRACTEQLRMKYGVSIKIVNRQKESDLYIVTAQAVTKKGKTDESIGAISIRGLTGESLANALMKAETKAKRRVTLSICGLGLMDEIEAKDTAEREVKEQDQNTAGSIQEKITATTDRPEYESASPEPIHKQEETPAHPAEYIIKCGKHKGKPISRLSNTQMKVWISYYEKMAKTKKIDPDVESDYLAIVGYIEDARFDSEQSTKNE
jgi:hypothetical protein